MYNVKHYKINMNAIHDQFLVGVGLMSDVLNERKEKQKKDKKIIQAIMEAQKGYYKEMINGKEIIFYNSKIILPNSLILKVIK